MATYRIAVGTLDGLSITEHFGRSKGFRGKAYRGY